MWSGRVERSLVQVLGSLGTPQLSHQNRTTQFLHLKNKEFERGGLQGPSSSDIFRSLRFLNC